MGINSYQTLKRQNFDINGATNDDDDDESFRPLETF